MQKQILQPTLSSDESQLYFIVCERNDFSVMSYHIEQKRTIHLYHSTMPIEQFLVVNTDCFIKQGERVLRVHKGKAIEELLGVDKLFDFNERAFVFEKKGVLYSYDIETNEMLTIVESVDSVYMTTNNMLLYHQNGSLYYVYNGEKYMLNIAIEIESAAASYDGQYIALFGEEGGERHFYVYDIEQGVLQNMTNVLGEKIGYAGPALRFAVKEIPSWTETKAFYFLVTANDETRLYYGDIYGTLLPASPEEQYVYAYAVAKSGNWSVNAIVTKDGQYKLQLLDITTGIEMEINT